MTELYRTYGTLSTDVERVRTTIEKEIRSARGPIAKPLYDLLASGGKMIRPAFLLLAANFGDEGDKEELIRLAAVVEMLHMATLIHDDIIDDSKMRRGVPTAQSAYGKDLSVFLGDYLFTKCFMMLSEIDDFERLQKLSRTISSICEGEILQYSNRFNTKLNYKTYLRQISFKTAALIAMSGYLGAYRSGASAKETKLIAQIGHYIGVTFQIIDDILDIDDDFERIGKSKFNDIKEGIITLPMIMALKKDDGTLAALLAKEEITHEELREIVRLVKELDGLKRAKAVAEKYKRKTFRFIDKLSDNEAKAHIRDLAEHLIGRDY